MSRTVSPPTQGIIASVTNGLSWARAPGAATAERTGGAPTGGLGTPGRLGSPRKLGFGLVGDRSEQPARIPMLTNVSSPARRYRDIAPSAVGLRLRRTASGQGLVSPRPMTVWLEGNRKGIPTEASEQHRRPMFHCGTTLHPWDGVAGRCRSCCGDVASAAALRPRARGGEKSECPTFNHDRTLDIRFWKLAAAYSPTTSRS